MFPKSESTRTKFDSRSESMSIRIFLYRLISHPLSLLYGVLLFSIALSAAFTMAGNGAWEAALVDLLMASILISFMFRTVICSFRKDPGFIGILVAWGMLFLVNLLSLLSVNEFFWGISSAVTFSLLICAFVLHFSGPVVALACLAPTLWCCVFMPYHEEFILLISYPLRLSATALSAEILRFLRIEVVYAGSSLRLPELNIAITDACSGINQLDAFILIACIAVIMMHRSTGWGLLHFAFLIPAIIIGNTIRIVLTVLLFRLIGEVVLGSTWHIALGYVQLVLALLIFLAVGELFRRGIQNPAEEEKR